MSIASRLRRIFNRSSNDTRYPVEHRVGRSINTLAGTRITADTAVTVPAVWACLRFLSQSVAVLPWHVMREGDRGSEIAKTHPVDWLIYKRPNPEWSAFQFRETLLHWALRWGNGYAEIERDVLRRPIALWPLHPDRVQPMRDQDGTLFYRVRNSSMEHADIPARDMFHLRGFGEGPVGVNVIDYAAESIGWARAAQLFGAAFFGKGMNPAGVVTSKRNLGETGLKRLRLMMNRIYAGVRGEKVVFLDAEMDFKPIAIEPEKAQFLATNQHLVEEICRWFGVPPHKVQHLLRATFSNIESQAIEVVVDSITPWVKRFEEEADYKLFGLENRNSFITKMNMTAMLRGDSQARAVYYKAMKDIGVFSTNDILALEDMPLISKAEGGDKRTMQAHNTTMDKIGEMPAPAPAAPKPATDPAQASLTNWLSARIQQMELEDV